MPMVDSPPATQFEHHTAEVYGWAYRILGRHDDALDVVQDVFLKWVEQCQKQPPEQPRGWLRKVALHQAIDLKRRHRRGPKSGADQVENASGRASGDGALAFDRATLRDDIAAALDQLTEIQQSVLIAKVYDELTFARIATELGLAVPTAKTHYLRAVRAVRDRLQARWA